MAARSWRRVLIGGGAAACLLLPGAAFADSNAAPAAGTLPTNPVALTGPVSGDLVASSGGSYSYAQFTYPGDGSTVTLNLTVDNALPLENGAAGFNVYQAGSLIGSSTANGPTTATFSLSSSTAGPVLIQVFDYDGSTGEAFTLTPQGLPAGAATTPATGTSTSTATSTSSVSQNPTLGASASGSLAGNSGGSFALYTLAYPGNNQVVTLSLAVSPSSEAGTGSVGFNVYDGSGNLVGSASQTDPSTLSLIVSNATGGNYTVQVFNYDPTTTISYTLSQANS